MNVPVSRRVHQLTTGIFSELAEKKRAAKALGQDVIDLSIGSPDLPPPAEVQKALVENVKDGSQFGYTLRGLPEFHEAAADFYYRRYGVQVMAETEVLQLMGSQDGLAHLATALLNPEDAVLVPNPGYPIYEASVHISGAQLIPMPLQKENGFLPDLKSLAEQDLSRVKLMILNYPGNPVTALANREFFVELVAFARRHNIVVAHDFAYSELVFDGKRPLSLLSIPGAKEVAVEFNSLSKTFNMAGCRIGYVMGNQHIIGLLGRLKSHIDYGIFEPIQRAGIAALRSSHTVLDRLVQQYEQRRNTLIGGLHEAGWPVPRSEATMFVWAPIPNLVGRQAPWTSREFSFDLLETTGVAVTPGNAFGSLGEGYVRIALVQPEQRLAEAAARINLFLDRARAAK
ncbi:aminotransferase class I/II-fold pyridoxal phosphate-dependent enzyme [Alicyclobacillus sp. SO9]|uniref:aminotransferase class I/II-fold pyridoxal phosphate-dependent enzyme n=1 Tax=Alicyclobacillus sp. SO9 TaxID=2665646 RepID=UPI0018E866B5|nr:aminotransferase class I/II-fold pyridoxal phosphate-dependent enzyme [Alicyclobacillus sp. SO9]QQE78806.1 aminotransferase class I/II-fold pyridoxal phosphate-dependent enzyme [Alicyclobacillus sp. SO9]